MSPSLLCLLYDTSSFYLYFYTPIHTHFYCPSCLFPAILVYTYMLVPDNLLLHVHVEWTWSLVPPGRRRANVVKESDLGLGLSVRSEKFAAFFLPFSGGEDPNH